MKRISEALSDIWWTIKYELTKCRCNGNPAKCNHKKHMECIGGGWGTMFREVDGGIEMTHYSHSDPAWQCSGCNFPLRPRGGWKK